MVVVLVIAILAAIAVARLARAEGAARSGSAVTCLRTVSSAQATARSTWGTFLPVADLADRGLLDGTFRASPLVRSGYRITETGSGATLAYNADPVSLSAGARRYFMRASDGVIRYSDTGDAATDASLAIGSE